MSQPQEIQIPKEYKKQVAGACIIGLIIAVIIIILIYIAIYWLFRFLFTGLTGSKRVGNIAGVLAVITFVIIAIACSSNRAQRAKENSDLRELLYPTV